MRVGIGKGFDARIMPNADKIITRPVLRRTKVGRIEKLCMNLVKAFAVNFSESSQYLFEGGSLGDRF